MAGDWIKVEENMPDKPEVAEMAELLDLDMDSVTGKLIRVWVWATRNCNGDGVTSVTAKKLLDRSTDCKGFADAMIKVGWLGENDGELFFPHFDRHNGKTAKSRALASKRVEKHRNAVSVTNPLPEKRREEKSKRLPPNPPLGGTASERHKFTAEQLAGMSEEADKDATPPKPPEDCPAPDIVRSFNETLGRKLPMVMNPTDKRRAMIRTAWKYPVIGQDFENIKRLWSEVKRSKFLMGMGRETNFKASFDWILGDEDRIVRIMEGQFRDEKR